MSHDSALAAIAASVAVIDKDTEGRLVFAEANERYRTMLAFGGEIVGRGPSDVLPSHLVADFVERVTECFATRSPIDFETVLESFATTTWWRTTLLPMLDEDPSRVSRVFVTAVDITEKKRLEATLRESRQRLEAIIDTAYDAIITVGADHRIRFMNGAALRMFGWQPQEILNRPLDMLLPPATRGQHQAFVDSFRQSPSRARGMHERAQIRGVRRTGEEFAVQISIAKVQLESGIEMTAIVRDVSENARLMAELHATAFSDSLTGLASRRRFNEALDSEIKRARRHAHPLSVLTIDIDHFKRINDTHGHPAGDVVLGAVGRLIGRTVRTTDIAARVGGEEFAVLLPETGTDGALLLAERIRAAVEELSLTDRRGAPLPISVSLGVASMDPASATAEELLSEADRALYAAKRSGRNRVELPPAMSLAPPRIAV